MEASELLRLGVTEAVRREETVIKELLFAELPFDEMAPAFWHRL